MSTRQGHRYGPRQRYRIQGWGGSRGCAYTHSAEIAWSRAVTAHARKKSWRKAIILLQDMDQRSLRYDAVACSAVMSVLSRVTKWREAGLIFNRFNQASLKTDVVVLNAAVNALAVGKQWRHAVNAMDSMVRSEIEPDMITFSTIIGVCGKEKQWQTALHLLEVMCDSSILPNVISYNVVISSCGKSLQWKAALELVDCMSSRSVSPTVATYSTSISMCNNASRWGLALSLFHDMQKMLIHPSTITCSAALQSCSSGRLWQAALTLFNWSYQEKIAPDMITYNATINAARMGQQWEVALQLFHDMHASSIKPSAGSLRVLMGTCEESQHWSIALSLLQFAQSDSIPIDSIAYLSAMNAAGKGYAWSVSLNLLSHMKESQLRPDCMCFSSAVSAMGQAREGRKAVVLLGEMHAARISPLQSSTNCAIDAYLRQCTPRDSGNVLKEAKGWKGEAGLTVYNALIGECGRTYAKDTVVELLVEMRENVLMPSASTYGAAIGVCGKAHEWKMALELFRTMGGDEPGGLNYVDQLAHTAVVTACARAAAWRHALALICRGASSERILSQPISSEACIAAVLACDRVGLWECAVLTFFHMSTLHLRPETHALNAAMSACRRSSAWEASLALWHSPSAKPLLDPTTCGLLLQACERAGRWEMALSWFHETRQACVELGTLAYNAAIFASAFGRDWSSAISLLRLMSESRTPMTRSTKNAALRACSGPERLVEATVALTLLQGGIGASRSEKWRDQNLSAHLEITEMSLQSDASRIESRIGVLHSQGQAPSIAGELLGAQALKFPTRCRVPAQAYEMLSSHLQNVNRGHVAATWRAVQSEVFDAFGHGAAYAHIVGSQLYRLGLDGSDVDILVELSPEVVSAFTAHDVRQDNERFISSRAVMEFRRHLDSDSCLTAWEQCDVALDAKRPILSAKYLLTATPVAVEVSFDQSLAALRKSALLASCANYDRRILQVAKVVRFWAGLRGLVGQRKGYLSGFAWCLMVVFYCQCRGMLPALRAAKRQDLRAFKDIPGSFSNDFHASLQIEDYDAGPRADLGVDSVALLPGFFAFYAHSFQWEEEVVSVRLGHRALRRYSSTSTLSIEDPVEIDVDLAAPYLNAKRDLRLRVEIRRAARYLFEEDVDERAWDTVFRRRALNAPMKRFPP